MATLAAGYSSENYIAPKDDFRRDQLFEPLGLAVAPDGTVVVATRTAGIRRLVAGEWRSFAEGLFDSLGVQVEDEHGLRGGHVASLQRLTWDGKTIPPAIHHVSATPHGVDVRFTTAIPPSLREAAIRSHDKDLVRDISRCARLRVGRTG